MVVAMITNLEILLVCMESYVDIHMTNPDVCGLSCDLNDNNININLSEK